MFQRFSPKSAIYFSIGAFFVNIVGGKLAPFNSKEIRRFNFSRFSLVRSQTHVTNTHFLQHRQVLNSDTRYPRNLNLVSGTRFRYSDAGTLRDYRIWYHHFTHGALDHYIAIYGPGRGTRTIFSRADEPGGQHPHQQRVLNLVLKCTRPYL
eukprot:SAG31_NODE_2_length_46263_cov_45.908043_29_plen_151_part_00